MKTTNVSKEGLNGVFVTENGKVFRGALADGRFCRQLDAFPMHLCLISHYCLALTHFVASMDSGVSTCSERDGEQGQHAFEMDRQRERKRDRETERKRQRASEPERKREREREGTERRRETERDKDIEKERERERV